MKLDFFSATPFSPARLVRDNRPRTPHRVPAPLARTEATAPAGVSPNTLNAVLQSLDTINRRMVRIETRLVCLMKDHGLDSAGRPNDLN